MILVGILHCTFHGGNKPVKLVVIFQISQGRCHIFSPWCYRVGREWESVSKIQLQIFLLLYWSNCYLLYSA